MTDATTNANAQKKFDKAIRTALDAAFELYFPTHQKVVNAASKTGDPDLYCKACDVRNEQTLKSNNPVFEAFRELFRTTGASPLF